MDSNRRKFIYAAGGLATITVGGIWLLQRRTHERISYSEAYKDPSKRDAWLEGLNGREYVTKKIATPKVLEGLKKEKDYTPPDGAFTATMPDDISTIGDGTRSTLYVFEKDSFMSFPRHEELGIVVENSIVHHGLVNADHFHHGIEGYDRELFFVNGHFDNSLFLNVSQIIGYKGEFEGLRNKINEGNFVSYYRDYIKDLALPHFINILNNLSKKELKVKVEKEKWF